MNWKVLAILLVFVVGIYGKTGIKLRDKNFEEVISTHSAILVKFISASCDNCNALKPVFKTVEKILKKENINCTLGSIHGDSQPRTSEKYKIQGFPTILLFINGTPMTYKGEREAEDIVKYISKMVISPTTELDSDGLKAIMDKTTLRAVLASDDKEAIDKYNKVAKRVYEYDFYHIAVKEAQKVFPKVQQNQVIIMKDFDEKTTIMTEDFNKKKKNSLREFLNLNMFPTVNMISINMTNKPIEKVLSKGERKGVFLFRSNEDPKRKEYDQVFTEVATEMKAPGIIFFIGDIKEPIEKQLMEIFGMTEEELPVIQAAEYDVETMMYRYEGEMKSESIKKFMTKWKEGKASRFYTSEPIPKDNPGPVFKVVGKTFKDEVINNDKNVLVRYYAPWCEFSAMVEPIFKRIAETLRDNDKVKFCEMDATKNDVEGYQAEGYPIIKFFPAGNKEVPIYYDEDFTEEAMVKFVEDRVGVTIKLTQESLHNYVKPDL